MDLVTSDHVRLVARRWSAGPPARGTVVLVHGFGAGVDEARVVSLAGALQTGGLDVLAFDARGHGGSGGETTLGDEEHRDVAAAVDAVRATGRPLVVVGASMGAIAALRYAVSASEPVAGVVTVSCPARWRLPRNARGVASALLTRTGLGRAVARRRLGVRIAPGAARAAPPVELVGSVGVPVAVVHGRVDPFIAVEEAELLYGAAGDPRRLDLVDGLGHAFDAPAVTPVLTAVNWCMALGPAPDPSLGRAGAA